jgi:hypothetical protein
MPSRLTYRDGFFFARGNFPLPAPMAPLIAYDPLYGTK